MLRHSISGARWPKPLDSTPVALDSRGPLTGVSKLDSIVARNWFRQYEGDVETL